MGALQAAILTTAVIVVLVMTLIASVAFVGVYRMLKYNAKFDMVWTPRAKISDIYDYLKTGDIILFVSSIHTASNSVLTQTFHSHAGVLIRDGDEIHISESHLGGILMPDRSRPGKNHHMGYGADILPCSLD